MSKMTSFRVIALALSMLMILGMAKGRWLDLDTYSASVISYGVHNISNENPPNLELQISNSSTSYGDKRCESLYRFLPCADTMPEGVFLMFMYTYLMMLGDEWIREGSEVLHVWMGDKKLGASVFRVLMAFPNVVVFVVPGILSSASDAQNRVVFGVNMYAGSTVITLTLVWGIGIIFSKHKLKKGSSIKGLSLKRTLSYLTDTRVNIDKETGKIAVIMLLSLIPFAFVGLVSFVNTPAMTLCALIVSGVSLLLYFVYQLWNPWIRARSLAYLKQENLRARFFYHVMRLADVDRLNDEQGNPNVTCFKKTFEEADTDNDKFISQKELGKLVEKVFKLEKDYISKEYAKAEICIRFDKDKDGKISLEEFERECTNWLEEGKNEANSSGSASKSIWNQVRQIEIKKQRSKLSRIEKFMPSILKQVLEKDEIMKDGEPNREMIKELLSQYDTDKDGLIHRDELKKFIETLRFGILVDHDRVLDELINDFDNDKNQSVDKEEFVDGIIKWIKKAINHDKSIKDPKEAIAKIQKDIWGEIDTLQKWKKPKAIVYLIFGAAIMITITSAFITSVKQFSNAAHIPFLFASFVLAPIALKAKMAIKALRKPHDQMNASLTFSEIYDELVMNNLLGLFSLLVTLYIKGLSWTYSAEVFTIMIPCAIVGIFAFKRDNYPLWASIPAILLYPVSVYIYYLLANA